ncbi:lipoyl synthase [Aceticella autotrophica]|uniref:Lipoyl synthase n=1 Tax=Aceticella autotrophica TaxID=2755338 RepID=A0A975AVN5_9THEO|nr:lipoyl synthase [Aceticella autotrophica]
MKRLPEWLTKRPPKAILLKELKEFSKEHKLHTVCESARCPNIGECFAKRTATFMILGDTCTRNCRFCSVMNGKPLPVDPDEPERVAEAVKELRIKHAVITSVTRDDLKDGGALIFAETVKAIRKECPNSTIELLIPDFKASYEAIEMVVKTHPEVIGHNVETVPRLYSIARPQAVYRRSLEVLKTVKEMEPSIYTKSGMMLGLGETKDEVLLVMKDLLENNCDMITLGQYLKPSKEQLEVKEFVTPEMFEEYKDEALKMGFKYVSSSPFVRSSYNAEEFFKEIAKG